MRTAPRPPSLFAGLESPGRREPMKPLAKELRDRGRLLQTVRNLRDFAALDGDAVYASVAVAVWNLTGEQARKVALMMASELESEVRP